jgi:hypothetical protein
MSTVHIKLHELPAALRRDERAMRRAIKAAISRTSKRAVEPIQSRVPVAFGELRDSVEAQPNGATPKAGVYAPHAGAVEKGSMPHTPNFEKLVAWVKLRGFQGLSGRGRIRKRFSRSEGPTTAHQARRVASAIKSHEIRGKRGVGRHLPIDAAEQVARAISRGIEKNGTRPHWYVRSSLPDIHKILDTEIKQGFARVTAGAANRGYYNLRTSHYELV